MKNTEPRDSELARLQKRALHLIHAGTQWLSAEELDALRTGLDVQVIGATRRWRASWKLFSIQRDGQEVFPRYAFGEDLEPLAAMRDIMKILEGWSALATARTHCH